MAINSERRAALRKHANAWLIPYYQALPDVSVVTGRSNARIKLKASHNQHRHTPTLIIYRKQDESIHTATVAVKGLRAYQRAAPTYLEDRLVKHALLIGVAGALLPLLSGILLRNWALLWISTPIIFVTVALTFILFMNGTNYYLKSGIIARVQQYPANERWICLTAALINSLNNRQMRQLHTHCAEAGIGILRVADTGKVTLVKKAVPVDAAHFQDRLQDYVEHDKIKQALLSQLDE